MIRLRFKEADTANIHCYNIQKHLSYEIFVSTLHPLITVDFQTNDYNMVDVDYRLTHKHFRGASEEAPNIFWFDIYNKYRNLCASIPPFMRGTRNTLLNELAVLVTFTNIHFHWLNFHQFTSKCKQIFMLLFYRPRTLSVNKGCSYMFN